jgi:hypothetical protein
MSSSSAAAPKTEADPLRQLLEHLRVYKVTTASIVTALLCGGSENAAKKLLARSRNLVESDPLGPKTVYYRLTPFGAKQIGAPEEIARPQGPQSLPKNIGFLGFCCSGPIQRKRYTRIEFVEDLPELVKDLLGKDYHTDFFLDFDGEHVRLGQVVVDLGGDYRKLISKCRVRLREYLEIPHIKDIVADGFFTFAIVVSEEEKAKAIKLALAQKPLRARVIVETNSELQKCPIQDVGGAN